MPSTDSNSLTLPLHVSGDNSSDTSNLASWREFFNIHALSIPDSFLDAKTRLNRNLTHFSGNYNKLVIMITFLYLGFAVVRPFFFTLFAFYLVSSIIVYTTSTSIPAPFFFNASSLGYLFRSRSYFSLLCMLGLNL